MHQQLKNKYFNATIQTKCYNPNINLGKNSSNLNSIYLDPCSNCSYETPTNAHSDHSEIVYEFFDCESEDAFGNIGQTSSDSALQATHVHPSVEKSRPWRTGSRMMVDFI